MSTYDSIYINLRTGQINLRCQKSGQYTLWGAGGQSVCLERDGCWLQENAVCENSSGYTLTCALESFDMYSLYSKAEMKLLQPENIPIFHLKRMQFESQQMNLKELQQCKDQKVTYSNAHSSSEYFGITLSQNLNLIN